VISKARPSFWRLYARMPGEVKLRAREVYRLFSSNPNHPSLRWKKLQAGQNYWSVRITDQYRAVGVRQGEVMEWIWIGTHNEFDKQFS
jgi:hypothetical protein